MIPSLPSSIPIDKIDEFASFCEMQGWTRITSHVEDEICRLRKDPRPLIIIRKSSRFSTIANILGPEHKELFLQWQQGRRS